MGCVLGRTQSPWRTVHHGSRDVHHARNLVKRELAHVGAGEIEPEGLSVQDPTSRITAKPQVDFVYIRDVELSRYQISENGEDITLQPSSVDLSHPTESPSFIGKRQRVLQGASTVTVSLADQPESVRAGLACYKDEHRYVRLFYDTRAGAIVFEVVNNAKKISKRTQHEVKVGDRLGLRLEYTEQEYRMLYRESAEGNADWKSVATVDTLDLTDPDFVGPIIGVFALADEQPAELRFQGLKIE